MTSPIDAKRALLEDVLTDVGAWAAKRPGHHGVEASRFVSEALAVLDLFAQNGSPIQIENATGLVVMALAWRAASGKTPLKQAIPKAREWLKGELAETSKAAQKAHEAANPPAWNEAQEHEETA